MVIVRLLPTANTDSFFAAWGAASSLLGSWARTGSSVLEMASAAANSAAIGAIAEKPELLGRTLILVGLAEGIAIYGLIVSILIFNQIT